MSARLEGRSLSDYPGLVPTDLESAYRYQDRAIDLWPDPIVGWKSTIAVPDHVDATGDTRLIGPVFASNLRDSQPGQVVDCPIFVGGLNVVESEIVVRIDSDAPEEKVAWTVDEAIGMIGDVHIGVEMAGSPLATLGRGGLPGLVSDFGGNSGLVVGRAVPGWRSIDEISTECIVGGVVISRGATSLREGPFEALAFVLAKCARRGMPVRRGAMITTGVVDAPFPIVAGQISHHVFAGIGEVRCRAVPATPHASLAADRS